MLRPPKHCSLRFSYLSKSIFLRTYAYRRSIAGLQTQSLVNTRVLKRSAVSSAILRRTRPNTTCIIAHCVSPISDSFDFSHFGWKAATKRSFLQRHASMQRSTLKVNAYLTQGKIYENPPVFYINCFLFDDSVSLEQHLRSRFAAMAFTWGCYNAIR